MMAEFALTPAVFDQSAHEDVVDWTMRLTVLASRMFPQPNHSPVLVTDMGGLWEAQTRRAVDAIGDPRARNRALDLFTKLKQRLVPRRPQPGAVTLGDERWWARAACASAAIEPIERMVASCGCQAALSGEANGVRGLHEVEGDEFWRDVTVEWSPPASVRDQVATLRKLCIHSEFLWLASPYVRGHADDETPFARDLIREVFRRPPGFNPPLEVGLHTMKAKGVTVGQQVTAIHLFLGPSLKPGESVRLFVWDKFEERVVLAGGLSPTSGGRMPAPRWGVHMGHIARRMDARGSVHEWKQLNDAQVGYWFRKFTVMPPTPHLITRHGVTGG
jgi:hypothetical protein